MALTAQEIFVKTVRFLSPEEQFHLSVLILQELSVENQSNTWSKQDEKDLTTTLLTVRGSTLYGGERPCLIRAA